MFNITLKLTKMSATLLEVLLRNCGGSAHRRGNLLRAGILLTLADQVHYQVGGSATSVVVPFPDAPPATYTQVLNGLIIELLGRTVESDDNNDWSHVLHSTADQLDKLHQGGE